MKETAIIYCRKSTDRDDRQQNTLEHQLNNCKKTARKNNLIILDEIKESASAKTGSKRAGFNRMMEACEKGKVDYIIIDETKRLARNINDTAFVINLLDTNSIKGLLTTEKRFEAGDSSSKLMLLFELGFAKKDNEDRSKDVKAKMITALNKGQWLSQAVFGYRNVGPKGKRDVKVIEKEANLVRQIFLMRIQRKTLDEIKLFLEKETNKKWTINRISRILSNTKYYGLQQFGGEEAWLNSDGYKPIISEELFHKVNNIKKVTKESTGKAPRHFNGIAKDTNGNKLYADEQKGHIYYRGGKNTPYKINISQKKLFKAFEEYVINYNFPKHFVKLTKVTLKDYYKDKVKNREIELRKISKDLNEAKTRLDNLLNLLLDSTISKEEYNTKKERLENIISNLKTRYDAVKQGDKNIISIIEDFCELVENLGATYKDGDEAKKGKIIRAMQCELIVDNKKELTIKESKLFEIIKKYNFNEWYTLAQVYSNFTPLYRYFFRNQTKIKILNKKMEKILNKKY